MVPSISFALLLLKNDWWQQSWNKIKVLIINPDAITTSGRVSQYETERLRYAPYQSASKGTNVLISCLTLAFVSVFSKGATCCFSCLMLGCSIVMFPPRNDARTCGIQSAALVYPKYRQPGGFAEVINISSGYDICHIGG
jgi:hypothetical protein